MGAEEGEEGGELPSHAHAWHYDSPRSIAIKSLVATVLQ